MYYDVYIMNPLTKASHQNISINRALFYMRHGIILSPFSVIGIVLCIYNKQYIQCNL